MLNFEPFLSECCWLNIFVKVIQDFGFDEDDVRVGPADTGDMGGGKGFVFVIISKTFAEV